MDSEPQAIHQADVRVVRLGVKPWERDTSFIVDGSTNSKKLTIGEAYITPGNWAGFPPHKHDVDNMPSEGVLEEIYYFLFDPQQGFGVQCLYTSDGEIDEAYRVKNDELVEFPRGYHTTVGAPGYNTYFLWLMAGKDQGSIVPMTPTTSGSAPWKIWSRSSKTFFGEPSARELPDSV